MMKGVFILADKEIPAEKVCFKCEKLKPISELYKHPQMGDGYLNKCKECNKKDVSKNYYNRRDQYVEYERKRAKLPHRRKAAAEYQSSHPEVKYRCMQRYRKKYPEKYRAHYLTKNAIRDGRLIKQPCELCECEYDIEAHHYDYSKPLDVQWLCRACHLTVHGKQVCEIKPDPAKYATKLVK
jgi:hypothetical protein